ncbi:helix-turn-helix domain-containing protein [Nonomuraea endophytica]|uniref:helix-turn-helix domain-containing protein n=1 Tax=Nonomuraea endophytica TaxID=714136 RepID=UPI0037C91B2D
MSRYPLGEFLRACRSRLTPCQAGLPAAGGRRVTGLRREEVAVLAGVSADYYARLEQGRETNPSAQVLAAIARALHLSADARQHAYHLAGLTPISPAVAMQVNADLLRLMDSFPIAVAYVLDDRLNVLAANPLADALLSPLADSSDMVASLFLDPAARELFADWDAVARDTVHSLRLAVGADRDDPAITALLAASHEFATLWHEHAVGRLAGKHKVFHHPRAGRIALTYQAFDIQSAPGQQLLIGTPEPASTAALARLRAAA